MSKFSFGLGDGLLAYMHGVSLREHPAQIALRERTGGLSNGGMRISPEQGALFAMLIELMGARRTLEIGVFTGSSSLAVALALPADGLVTALDVSDEWTAIAREHWAMADVAKKIELILGPALESLEALLAEGRAGTYDFAFIDADKTNQGLYYERALELLRPGGLVAIDNVLWGGDVADPDQDDADTEAIRKLNAKLRDDQRVSLAMLPVGDGLTLARKRP
jgi:predicted O-methyltransferase YrrM